MVEFSEPEKHDQEHVGSVSEADITKRQIQDCLHSIMTLCNESSHKAAPYLLSIIRQAESEVRTIALRDSLMASSSTTSTYSISDYPSATWCPLLTCPPQLCSNYNCTLPCYPYRPSVGGTSQTSCTPTSVSHLPPLHAQEAGSDPGIPVSRAAVALTREANSALLLRQAATLRAMQQQQQQAGAE